VASVDVPAVPARPHAERIRGWFLRHVARPHPPQEFVPQIDGLRFVAIMSVLLYHVQGFVMTKMGAAPGSAGLLQRVLGEGAYGVPLFFAISGYILCRPFLGGKEVSLKRYFLRRLSRLEPPYIISMLLIFALKVSVLGIAAAELFPHLGASLLYLHNLAYGAHSEVNGVAWSLEVEWQFYLLAPLLFLAVARSDSRARHWLLLAGVVLGGLVYAAGGDADPRLALSLLRYAAFFLAGVWVAVLDEDHRELGRGGSAMDFVGVGAALLIVWCLLDGGIAPIAALPLLTALVLLGGIRGRWLRRLLGWWPIYCIGAMCYTIYLYHFFVISALGKLLAASPWWPQSPALALVVFALVCVPVVVAACLLPYLLIERPFMVWRPGKNRLSDAFRELRY
jgi:peptidoglycan/LPS O-acetylase OafA/YrhL